MNKQPEKYTLVTNLSYVSCGPMRAHCSALLLMDSEGLFEGSRLLKVRGFGARPEMEHFDIFLDDLSYTLTPWETRNAIVIGDSGEMSPLAAGYIMKFKGGLELQLSVADQKSQLRLDQFEGTDSPVLRVWEVLPLRVQQFWRAPYIPVGYRMLPSGR